MSEERKYFKNGVEYYFKFTLKMEVGPWDGSEISWKIGMKKFKVFSKEKE